MSPRCVVPTVVAIVAACGGGTRPTADAPAPPARALGMNDVTVLLPLPVDPHVPVLMSLADGDGADDDMVQDNLYAALVDRIGPKNGLPVAYADYQVVAVRVDLCDRPVVGPCDPTDDGRLRLVLQPMYTLTDQTAAHDIGIHAFFPIPNAELAGVIAELRGLAELQDVPVTARLGVSPAPPAYLDGLRALVARYARWDRLAKITIIGQRSESAAFSWFLKGYERVGAWEFQLIQIPDVNVDRQEVTLQGGDGVYLTEPVVDDPPGFGLAINGQAYAAAPIDQQRDALAGLVAIQNPELHDAVDTQCMACHVATYLTKRRSEMAGIDPATLPDRFTSTYDTSVDTIAGTDPRVVRGLGWAATSPAISQRVANDTARALAEIEARFPP